MVRTLSLLVLGISLLLPPAPAPAQVRAVTVEVDGLACPFCAYGVEKRLRKVDGVGSVTVSSSEGLGRMSARDGASIAVDQVPAAIEKAGFTPGALHVEVVGTLSRDEEGHVVLEVAGSRQSFELAPSDDRLEALLERLLSSGTPVRVTGTVPPASLEAGSWKLIPDELTGASATEAGANGEDLP